MTVTDYLISRWPGVFGESRDQRAANMGTGHTKPEGMSWTDWSDDERPGYWEECHWYDEPNPNRLEPGHCSGVCHHDHQPRIMRWYWASPLSWVVPPLAFWREGASVGLALSLGLGQKLHGRNTESASSGLFRVRRLVGCPETLDPTKDALK